MDNNLHLQLYLSYDNIFDVISDSPEQAILYKSLILTSISAWFLRLSIKILSS